jgi:MSHA biogenesis protein MshJ
MKRRLQWVAARIDALTLRERAMLFAGAAAAIVFLLYAMVLNPLIAKQKVLRAELAQLHDNIAGIDREIGQRLQAYAVDPDAAARSRLGAIGSDTEQLAGKLRAMQNGLVAPERIAPLLETILKSNGKLQLVAMKTLPVSPLSEAAAPASAARAEPVAVAAVPPVALLYRHGVEISVRGNYLDMVNYMDALESMPTQLFWGRAELAVEQYPHSRLTLTLYTLSLDRKWIKL